MKINCFNSNKHLVYLPMCWDNALLSYSKMTGQNYEKTYARYWRFDYAKKNETLGQGMLLEHHMRESLKETCKTEFKIIYYEDFQELLNVISVNLKNNILTLIHIDNFYTPWNGMYHIMHTQHIVLVSDLDTASKKIHLVDTDFVDEVYEVEFEVLTDACKFYVEFNKLGEDTETPGELLLKYTNCGNLIDTKMFNGIREFAEDFKKYFDHQIEYRPPYGEEDVLYSPLIMGIRKVIMGRDLFNTFLHSAGNDLNLNFEPVEHLLLTISSRWNNIITMLYKQMILNWRMNMNESISKFICDIADLEEQAYHLMLQIIDKKNDTRVHNKIKPEPDNFYVVPLSRYFNNKGLAAEAGELNHDLTGTSEYVVVKPEYQNKLYENGSEFFYIDLRGECNNVICEAQQIQIHTDIKYNGMSVLVCSDWGTNYEMIECFDHNGYSEKVYISGFNINELHKKYEHTIKVGASYHAVSHEMIRQENVFTYNQIYFDKGMEIDKIVLPYCSNLHIFSIVLF